MILNGTYTLPASPFETSFYQELRATTNGTSGIITCIRMSGYGEVQYRIYYPSTGGEPTITVYRNGAWVSDAWRTLSFDEQEVSEDLYCFVTNKKRLNGTYILNDRLNFSPFSPPEEQYIWGAIPIHEEAVSFTSNGQTFNSFKVCHFYLELALRYECCPMYDDRPTMYQPWKENEGYELDIAWYSEAYKTVTFEEQYVSKEFLEWLLPNSYMEGTYSIKGSTLKGIGDAIRKKTGKTQSICVGSFKNEIDSISFDLQQKSLSVYGNGTYKITPDAGFDGLSEANIRVNVLDVKDISSFIERSVTSIEIPEEVTKIGAHAFRSCSMLSSVVIPNSVISIGEEALCGLDLTEIELPDSVISLGERALAENPKLQNAVIGCGITEICAGAFEGCKSLDTVICNASAPPLLGEGAFEGVSDELLIYVPKVSAEYYRAAPLWIDIADHIIANGETFLDGSFLFAEKLTDCEYFDINISFTSNGVTYDRIGYNPGLLEMWYGNTDVYGAVMGEGWVNDSFREVTFRAQYVPDGFYSWLMSNATRIS